MDHLPAEPSGAITWLEQFVETHYVGTQRYLILSLYPGLPAPVVASAWGAQLRLRGRAPRGWLRSWRTSPEEAHEENPADRAPVGPARPSGEEEGARLARGREVSLTRRRVR